MTEVSSSKKKYKTPERANLTSASNDLVTGWLGQIQERMANVKVTKSDLVNWIIESKGTLLTAPDLCALEHRYFDPIKALESAAMEAKKLRACGQEIDLHQFLKGKIFYSSSRKRSAKLRAPKDNKTEFLSGSGAGDEAGEELRYSDKM